MSHYKNKKQKTPGNAADLQGVREASKDVKSPENIDNMNNLNRWGNK